MNQFVIIISNRVIVISNQQMQGTANHALILSMGFIILLSVIIYMAGY